MTVTALWYGLCEKVNLGFQGNDPHAIAEHGSTKFDQLMWIYTF